MKPDGLQKVNGFYVLVKQEKVEETSEGGIIIHASEQAKRLEQNAIYFGEVVDIGETAWYDYTHKYGQKVAEPWAKIGDRVVFTKHGGRHIELPGSDEEYVVVRDGDILVTLEKEVSHE
jgi:co-chaperonin GroES (HSP10)